MNDEYLSNYYNGIDREMFLFFDEQIQKKHYDEYIAVPYRFYRKTTRK